MRVSTRQMMLDISPLLKVNVEQFYGIECEDFPCQIAQAGMWLMDHQMSNVHNSWMRITCGRIKSDYRYSKEIVHNAFPWPNPTDGQKGNIEAAAQGVLDARTLFPNDSLADLYDPLTMPPELLKAHRDLDRDVMCAYGFDVKEMTEESCAAELMRRYAVLMRQFGKKVEA